MIILFFLFSSCVHTTRTDGSQITDTDNIDFEYFYDEELWEKKKTRLTTQEKAQFFWLRGLATHSVDDFLQSRAQAFACIHKETDFSIEQIKKNAFKNISLKNQKRDCSKKYASDLIPLSATKEHAACVTWMILSWSKLLQYYQLHEVMLDAEFMFLLSAWLIEQDSCIDNPWMQFAILVGLLQNPSIPTKESWEYREEYTEDLLTYLWTEPHIGEYVRLWYITYRLQKGDGTAEQKKEWILDLSNLEMDLPEKEELLRILQK